MPSHITDDSIRARLAGARSLGEAARVGDSFADHLTPVASKGPEDEPSPPSGQYKFIFTWWAFKTEEEFEALRQSGSYPRSPDALSNAYYETVKNRDMAKLLANEYGPGKVVGKYLGFSGLAAVRETFAEVVPDLTNWEGYSVLALGAAIPFPQWQDKTFGGWFGKNKNPSQADLDSYSRIPPHFLEWRWVKAEEAWLNNLKSTKEHDKTVTEDLSRILDIFHTDVTNEIRRLGGNRSVLASWHKKDKTKEKDFRSMITGWSSLATLLQSTGLLGDRIIHDKYEEVRSFLEKCSDIRKGVRPTAAVKRELDGMSLLDKLEEIDELITILKTKLRS